MACIRHGLATGAMLDDDVTATSDRVGDGVLELRDGPGHGVEVDPAAIERLAGGGDR